jgi:transcriptional regulator with PAS, ATPase and Fis domain
VLEEKKIRPVGAEREVPVDVRIVAATNRDLAPMVAAGRFRQDLYYRLDVVSVTIPPLRERREDIMVLARHFMQHLSAHLGMPPVPLTRDVADALSAYHWPGNARELRNLMERSLILGRVPLEHVSAAAPAPAAPAAVPPSTLEDVEKRHILDVLRAAAGNKSEAARRLGISRKTLERKCALWKAA